MAIAIYVTSTQTFSGKSALCVGLLRRFQRDGYRVGYMKPVSTMARYAGGRVIDEDAHFVKYTLGLADAPETMAPVLLNDQNVMAILAGELKDDFSARVKAAYETIAAGKDLVVLEGGANLREGWIINLPPARVVDLVGGREVTVVPYQDPQQVVDDLLAARLRLGDSLTGGVINRVPADLLSFVLAEICPFVERQGIAVLGCLPQEQALLSASVAELVEGLNAEVLCAHHALGCLVENLMVGAMDVDKALAYFRQTPNKAVITSGDRTDILLSALETSTCCLILTGNQAPSAMILERADAAGVPVLVTAYDTLAAVEVTDRFFGKSRFHQQSKVERFDALLNERLDFARLYIALGLGSG